MNSNITKKRGMRKGNMPFAMIAVTLLILAGLYGVVTASIKTSQDNMDDMRDEMGSVGTAMNFTAASIERGIGEIILDMGRNDLTEGLEERYATFDSRINKWISFQFPMRASGAVVNVISHDIELGVGSLKAASDTVYPMDGVRPSCFRADGNVTMSISTSSGNVIRDVYVSADGMSALPMLLENASQFELSITGPWSLITELMTYQLTSLAQYRVMSGYGASSVHGERGTNAIITEEDVKLAYRIALSVAETTYLRTVSDDEFDHSLRDRVDTAELLAFRDGYIEIDLGAVLAQTLVGIADDLITKWMDYLMLTKLLDIAEAITDGLKKAYNWLHRAISGTDAERAQDYLSATMSAHGIPESEYRYLLSGSDTVNIPGTEYAMDGIGDNLIVIPEFTSSFLYPNVDVLRWNGWNGFMNRYNAETNQIREALRGTINSIAEGIAGTYGLGTIRVECDPYDGTDFMTAMSNAIREALSMQRDAVENSMESTIRDGKIIDALYVAIYNEMESGKDYLFGVTALKNNIRTSIKTQVTDHVRREYGMPLDPSVIDSVVNDMMLSDDVINIIKNYERLVDERMELFRDVLNNIEKNTRSIFKDIIIILVRYGMGLLGLFPLLEVKMIMLVEEMAEYASLNPLAGIYELPRTDSFILEGNDGTVVKECVSLDCDVNLDVNIISPTKNTENVHYVGLNENYEASYSSMFRIFVTADVRYRAESSSSIMRMLGTYGAAVEGFSHSEFDIAIAVMSGWALTGVDYDASRTILDDAVALILKLIEPLLKPLFELIKLGKSILNVMMSALMRVSEFVTDLLMKLYNIIMAPIEFIGQLLNDILGKIFDDIVTTIEIKLKSQTIGFELYGMRLQIITNIIDEITKGTSTTKISLTLPIFGVTLTVFLDMKKDKSSKYTFTGGLTAEAETWNLTVVADPFMKTKKHIVEINGTFRGTDIHAVMPQLVQYEEMEFRLSDVPGVGTILSNIPLPIPGMKGSIDAGFELKYNMPYIYGVVINEFELNPPGEDRDNEWVELYNSTLYSVDLEGYRLVPSSNPKKVHVIQGATLGPGERMTITFAGQFLNNTRESITLYDPDGNEVDSTPVKNDTRNDDFTWQRETDASAKWVLKKGTKDADNGGKIMGGNPIRAALVQCVIAAAEQAFKEMGLKIIGPDGVALFLKRVLELTIEKAIDMIASIIVSASVFIEIVLSDATGSIGSGIRFSLMFDKEIIKDGLTWAVGQITAMMKHIDNPTGMTPKQIISDDIYFQTMIFAQVTTPKILGSLGNKAGVTAGLVISCNITALCNLFGRPGGTWKVNIGLVLEDIPAGFVPPMMKADPDKKTDLWIFRMTLERSKMS
jgi:hypothetical protein